MSSDMGITDIMWNRGRAIANGTLNNTDQCAMPTNISIDGQLVYARRQEEDRYDQYVRDARSIEHFLDRTNSRLHHVEEKLRGIHRNPVITVLENEILELRKRIDKLEAEKRAKRDKQIKQKNIRNNSNNIKNNTKEDILKKPYGY